MSKSDGTVEINCEVRRTTAAAICIHDGKTEAWLPKSQISDWSDGPSDAPGPGTTSVFVPEWLAIEKGLV